jgi:hypothetical protein
MSGSEKIYSIDASKYEQKSIGKRLEALFLNNIGLVVRKELILKASRNPDTGSEPENWHQRLSELRTDKGYTILSWRDTKMLALEEYLMPHSERRVTAGKRVLPTKGCWAQVLARASNRCEWSEDGQGCGLTEGVVDPIGGGTVKLTPDHSTPHSVNPNTDTTDSSQWQALCSRHQVMKKNYWDSSSGKINLIGILQAVSKDQKEEAFKFLLNYFGKTIKEI